MYGNTYYAYAYGLELGAQSLDRPGGNTPMMEIDIVITRFRFIERSNRETASKVASRTTAPHTHTHVSAHLYINMDVCQ